jgi:hypothetical protein
MDPNLGYAVSKQIGEVCDVGQKKIESRDGVRRRAGS